jgi:hypothetical protein
MTFLCEIRHRAPLAFNNAENIIVMLAKHSVIHDSAFQEPFTVAHMLQECEFDAV